MADAPVVDTPQASIEGQAPLDAIGEPLVLAATHAVGGLAVVPADSGLDVREVGRSVVELGHMVVAASLRYLNATGAGFAGHRTWSRALPPARPRVSGGRRLRRDRRQPGDTRVGEGCEARRDGRAPWSSRIAAARKTIDAVGREHVLAAVTLRPRR